MRSRLRALGVRSFFLPWLAVSFALTGCPLSDRYSLMSDDSAGAAGTGGILSSAGSGGVLGTGGESGGAGTSGSSSAGHAGASTGGISGNGGISGTGMNFAGQAAESGEAGQATSGGVSGSSLGGSAGAATAGGSSGSAGAGGNSGASGAGGAAASAGAGGMCSASTCTNTCCSDKCVDLTRDFANCGACGTVCNAPRSCMTSQCSSGWVPMSAPPTGFVARWRAAGVAMGSSVFVWGGSDSAGNVLDTGAIYDTTTDSWTSIAKDANTPTARVFATAVWTGSVVIVFGGSDASGVIVYKDAAVYDPGKNVWSAIAPAAKQRSMALGFWDGTRAVFYGGVNGAFPVAGADRFDLSSWTSSTMTNDPGAISNFACAWNGDSLLLQGGILAGMRTDKVFCYTSTTDVWTSPTKNITARSNAFGVWDGARFVVWGGRNDLALVNDGKSFNGTSWAALSPQNAPTPRMAIQRRHGWAFRIASGQIALFGGQTSLSGQGTFSTGGATYDVTNAKWAAIAPWPSAETHDYGLAVWTGAEFVLWGGRTGTGPSPQATLTGERWAP